jgi:carbamoyltransferase
MKILGINHDMYITSAALVEDGRIIAACPEERLNRQKHTRVFPRMAVEYCLSQEKCSLEEVDYVANAYNPGVHLEKFNPILSNSRRFRGDYLYSVPDHLVKMMVQKDVDWLSQTIQFSDSKTEIFYLNHHMCHAANGFLTSPFQHAAILTADGRGETDTVTFNIGEGNKIKRLKAISIPQSMGGFYSAFTAFLGFRPNSDEWKVMALSSYSEKNNKYYHKLKELVQLKDDGGFEIDLTYFKEFVHETPGVYTDKLVMLLGKDRKQNDKLEPRHYEIAAAMQQITEETMSHCLNWLQRETGLVDLVVAGGLFMNSVFNGKIHQTTPFKNVYVSSCPDDSGLSIGAALCLYHHILDRPNRQEFTHSYYGPEYSDNQIKETLDKYGLTYEYHKDIEKVTAKKISDGKLVGWFQGRMEFGQRALGNRSIIADPRFKEMKDKLNLAVKYREAFRPFAPAVLEEKAHDFFDMPERESVSFMEKVYPVKIEKRETIPAVTHQDGSGRLQSVAKDNNPRFHLLISEFEQITKIPVVINTSFNLNGEPVVCSPTDAIRTFYSCGLDILVIGNYLIVK